MTPRDILRLTAVPLLALAVTVGFPGHGVIGLGPSLAHGAVGMRLMHDGAIAFVSVEGRASLKAINPDGTVRRRLTRPCMVSLCIIRSHVWSPNGRRIAFLRGHSGGQITAPNLSLFVVNANGTGEKSLARCAGDCGADYASSLTWSPDGIRIVFSRARSLYVVNASTGRVRRLTRCSSTCFDIMPDWSPDGARIAFIRNGSLYIVNADGSGLRRLPQLGVADPVWSPDGNSIAFNSNEGISTIHPDGSHLQLLTHFSGVPGSGPGEPIWSPNGTHIAFFRTPGHPGAFSGELWVMNANGTHPRRLYRQASPLPLDGPAGPEWSPDGRYIAFDGYHVIRKNVSGWNGIYLMNASGGHLHLLASGGAGPAWQPAP